MKKKVCSDFSTKRWEKFKCNVVPLNAKNPVTQSYVVILTTVNLFKLEMCLSRQDKKIAVFGEIKFRKTTIWANYYHLYKIHPSDYIILVFNAGIIKLIKTPISTKANP